MAADIASFAAMMERDEDDTLRRLRAPQQPCGTSSPHATSEQLHMYAEQRAGRRRANAPRYLQVVGFVVLPGRNHWLIEGEPAAERFWEELELFLRET